MKRTLKNGVERLEFPLLAGDWRRLQVYRGNTERMRILQHLFVLQFWEAIDYKNSAREDYEVRRRVFEVRIPWVRRIERLADAIGDDRRLVFWHFDASHDPLCPSILRIMLAKRPDTDIERLYVFKNVFL